MSIVSLNNVTREYEQGGEKILALNGVTLDIGPGEFTAIMGPSGSGKSTMLNLIGALDRPSAGMVKVDGSDLGSMDKGQLSDMRRDRIGFVFQAYNLIPVLTALENTEFVLMLRGVAAATRQQKAREVLEAVGLKGMEDRRPGEMSGGQQQRVAVARAVAAEPAVILADEPTANLDSKTKQALLEMMKTLNEKRGITFIFSTHDPAVIDMATRVIELKDGQVVGDKRK